MRHSGWWCSRLGASAEVGTQPSTITYHCHRSAGTWSMCLSQPSACACTMLHGPAAKSPVAYKSPHRQPPVAPRSRSGAKSTTAVVAGLVGRPRASCDGVAVAEGESGPTMTSQAKVRPRTRSVRGSRGATACLIGTANGDRVFRVKGCGKKKLISMFLHKGGFWLSCL